MAKSVDDLASEGAWTSFSDDARQNYRGPESRDPNQPVDPRSRVDPPSSDANRDPPGPRLPPDAKQPFDADHKKGSEQDAFVRPRDSAGDRRVRGGFAMTFRGIFCCSPLPVIQWQSSSEGSEARSSHEESSENSETKRKPTLPTAPSDVPTCHDEMAEAAKDFVCID